MASSSKKFNPYEADPSKIPHDDGYADVPTFGRYLPSPDDFKPDSQYIGSTAPEALAYWDNVLSLCTEATRMIRYESAKTARDIYAIGSIIVKANHLWAERDDGREYNCNDVNEVAAIALMNHHFPDIKVPEIYFSGQLRGCSVLIQSRIPGVCLSVAVPYLSEEQKLDFKRQVQEIIRRMDEFKSRSGQRTFINPGSDPSSLCFPPEDSILFDGASDSDTGLTHNDLTEGNIIVNDDKVVALIDWERAGFFGIRRAMEVHRQCRYSIRDFYERKGLFTKEKLDEMFWWMTLYDEL